MNKFVFSTILFFLFTGFAVTAATVLPEELPIIPEAPAATGFAVIPENPRPGEPITIGARYDSRAGVAVLIVGQRRLSRVAFFQVPSYGDYRTFLAAVLAVPSTVNPNNRAVILVEDAEGTGGILGVIPLDIAPRQFESETIPLTPALTMLRSAPNPQRTAEAHHLWSILNRTGNEVFATDNFISPVESTRRTSRFGSRRVFRYADGRTNVSIHAGIDYGVPTGTRVVASGPGRVVLARYRIISGHSVIIEHLPGVYSMYYHLYSVDVSEGDMVETGTFLGLSGATGLATGPHLHWEIRVSGENTDPDAFVARPIIDRRAILSMIY